MTPLIVLNMQDTCYLERGYAIIGFLALSNYLRVEYGLGRFSNIDWGLFEVGAPGGRLQPRSGSLQRHHGGTRREISGVFLSIVSRSMAPSAQSANSSWRPWAFWAGSTNNACTTPSASTPSPVNPRRSTTLKPDPDGDRWLKNSPSTESGAIQSTESKGRIGK